MVIKLLQDVIHKSDLLLSQSDIVKVLHQAEENMLVLDIMGNVYTIPLTIRHKIIKSNIRFPKVKITDKMIRMTAALSISPAMRDIDKRRAQTLLNQATQRNIATAQSIAANTMTTTDPVILAKLCIASNLLSMSTNNGATQNTITKLQQLSKKIIAEI